MKTEAKLIRVIGNINDIQLYVTRKGESRMCVRDELIKMNLAIHKPDDIGKVILPCRLSYRSATKSKCVCVRACGRGRATHPHTFIHPYTAIPTPGGFKLVKIGVILN